MTRLVLPWPVKALSSNARVHWATRAVAVKKARRDACLIAMAAKLGRDKTAVLVFTYHPPTRARRDVQNMPHLLKAAIDGIADAMGCDDHAFRPRFPDHFAAPVKHGAVIVEISAE